MACFNMALNSVADLSFVANTLRMSDISFSPPATPVAHFLKVRNASSACLCQAEYSSNSFFPTLTIPSSGGSKPSFSAILVPAALVWNEYSVNLSLNEVSIIFKPRTALSESNIFDSILLLVDWPRFTFVTLDGFVTILSSAAACSSGGSDCNQPNFNLFIWSAPDVG